MEPAGPAGQDASSVDSIEEFLSSVLVENPEEPSRKDFACENASVERGFGDEIWRSDLLQSEMERVIQSPAADTWESTSGFASVSSSDADAEGTAPLPSQVIRNLLCCSIYENIVRKRYAGWKAAYGIFSHFVQIMQC